ncbi:MAG: NAD(P)/FAD-dependent oxidoreductase, partial [Myxococcales bacterium]|nr:NAD(P)/FAD-dependent oxidoreductase [Myxococcales bacterium]
QARGVEFREQTKVTGLLRDDRGDICGVKSEGGELEADLVVCADGSPSRFSTDDSPRTTIQTLMGWYQGTGFTDEEAWMIWDGELDGYYFWVFPEPCGVFNVGLTIPGDAPNAKRLKELFAELLDRHCALELQGAEQIGKLRGHPAVVTNRVGKIAERRGVWVGEAARLVMPGTVEGIGFALESGLRGAEFIHRHMDRRRGLSPLACRRYQLGTAKSMLPKFWAGQAWVKAARSPRARAVGQSLLTGRLRTVIDKTLYALLGDESRAA